MWVMSIEGEYELFQLFEVNPAKKAHVGINTNIIHEVPQDLWDRYHAALAEIEAVDDAIYALRKQVEESTTD